MESTAAGTSPDRRRETIGGCYTTAVGQGASGAGVGPRKSIQASGTKSAAIWRNNLGNLGNRTIAESLPANRTTTARARCLYKLRYHPLKCRQPKQRPLASTTGRAHGSLRQLPTQTRIKNKHQRDIVGIIVVVAVSIVVITVYYGPCPC